MMVAAMFFEGPLTFGSGRPFALRGGIGITAPQQDRGQLAPLLGRGREIRREQVPQGLRRLRSAVGAAPLGDLIGGSAVAHGPGELRPGE